jgi:long-subunit fatty acid transport protein
MEPLLPDPLLGAFAVRVIAKAAAMGAKHAAISALGRGRRNAGSVAIAGDIDGALDVLRRARSRVS